MQIYDDEKINKIMDILSKLAETEADYHQRDRRERGLYDALSRLKETENNTSKLKELYQDNQAQCKEHLELLEKKLQKYDIEIAKENEIILKYNQDIAQKNLIIKDLQEKLISNRRFYILCIFTPMKNFRKSYPPFMIWLNLRKNIAIINTWKGI